MCANIFHVLIKQLGTTNVMSSFECGCSV